MAKDLTAIIGAGALGAMYAGQIHRAGLPVAFVAEGERAHRLQQNGLIVNGTPLDIPVIGWESGAVARIIVAVKHHHLREICRRLSGGTLTDRDTVVLSVMNGIDSEHDLQTALDAAAVYHLGGSSETDGASHTDRGSEADGASHADRGSEADGASHAARGSEAVGASHAAGETAVHRPPSDTYAGGIVLPAMAAGMDAVRSGDEIVYTSLGKIFFGAPPTASDDHGRMEAAVEHMRSFLDRATIPGVIPDDITRAIWSKFMLNVGINQWSAVLGAPYSVFHREGPGRALMRSAMQEVLTLARRNDVGLTESDLEGWFSVVETLSAEGKTSMLQDIEARRKTEVEMFAGRIVEMGEAFGIPTPVNRCLLDAILALEEMQSTQG